MSVGTGQFSEFSWRNIGPPRGGRVVAVAGDPVDPAVFWFGACAGGVWRTDDAGTYWRNVSDGWFKTAAVGAIAVAASDRNVVYAGMGESCVRNDVSHGDGVYRTTDGGRTWQHLGLEATRHIARVRVHPADPDLVYVAALGDIFGTNPERGVFRSTDGGTTWDHVLFKSDQAGAADLSMDAANPRILYAGLWHARRTPWSMESGGPDSGMWRSTDGGDTWVDITERPGLPKGLKGRIGVAASPARSGRVWALIEAADGGGVYRSEDAGESWDRVSEDKAVLGRPWYYSHIVPDPQDADTVYSLNFQFWKSSDGGATFSQITTPHGDNHDLWIDPANPRRMIEGNDGGACVSFNGGETFSTIYNQPTGQIYHVVCDDQFPYRVYGTQQDNSAISVPSRSRKGAILWSDCYQVGHSESGYIAVDPTDPNIVFSGAVGSAPGGGGPLLKYDHRTEQTQIVTVWPEYNFGEDPSDWKHRFQWTYPIVFSPHDPHVLYITGERVFRSTDHGQSWEAISPDLTRADPDKMKASGGPINKDTSGAEVYCTIFAFAESPHEAGVFWAGSDDGLVHLSRDGGEKWIDVTPTELPEWSLVTSVAPSPHDPAAAYLCATRYRLADRTPYLFKTTDYGQTWQRITDGIPDGDFCRVLRPDTVRVGLLFAGTETSIYTSLDDGRSWQSLAVNLPAVPVYDIVVKDADLVIASHGRGFWILDDITPLRELPADLAASPAVLFSPPAVYRYPTPRGGRRVAPGKNYLSGSAYVEQRHPDGSRENVFLDAGTNSRDGLTVWYHLRDDVAADALELTFASADGETIRSFTPQDDAEKAAMAATAEEEPEPLTESGPEGEEGEGQDIAAEAETEGVATPREKKFWERLPNTAGLNRFTWDLRGDGVRPVPGKDDDRPATGFLVPPGAYEARLRVGDEELRATFEVRRDPRLRADDDDLAAQHGLLLEILERQNAVNDAIGRIRKIRAQVEPWSNRQEIDAAITSAARDLTKALTAVEERLTQTKFTHDTDRLKLPQGLDGKLAPITQVVASADNAPTQAARDVFADVSQRVDAVLADLDQLVGTSLVELNDLIARSSAPTITST